MQNLDSAFSALSDPTRRAILARLALGETTVMELARPFEMSQPAISRHLRVLENAGLILRRVEGSKHPCRLARQGLDEIDQWLEMLRTALENNYHRLDHLLAEMKSPNHPGGKDLSPGTPTYHPGDKDLSPGTPTSKEKNPHEQPDTED
jgi:DNA-binding transcriptional ArsR family regulator